MKQPHAQRYPPQATRLPADSNRVDAGVLLKEWIASSLVLAEDWELLPAQTRDELTKCVDPAVLLGQLVQHGLLTAYQADRLKTGNSHGLVLGNYRILERMGAGSMGVVYKAENVKMRRPVAIKVLVSSRDQDSRLLLRFFAEMRVIAQLQHPNIIAAMDAGEIRASSLDSPALHYLVMEFVPGQDLEEYVRAEGPVSQAKACDLIHQIASALAEAHKHQLVHRDLKPSNIRITPEGQAKLLDFGLARHLGNRLTQPGIILGSIDYIAPEQAQDASSVDIRADIYSLGGALFWCLTGRPPFPSQGDLRADLARRLNQAPPSVRIWRPEIPAGLDALVARMMAIHADERYPTPLEVMRALLPFVKPGTPEKLLLPADSTTSTSVPAQAGNDASPAEIASKRVRQILVVDDEASIRKFCGYALQGEDVRCEEAANGIQALETIKAKPYDLVLLDIDMPAMTGQEVLVHLREDPPWPHLKIIMFSGRCSGDEMAQMMLAGADDYLTKPMSLMQLRVRVKAALQLKEAQDRSDLLNRRLLAVNTELERNLTARSCDLVQARNSLVMALAKLAEHRDRETGAHLLRLQRYCRCLAEEAAKSAAFADQIDANFIDMLECCAPLHDIGKAGLPDHVLLKPGKLTRDERVLMETHTVIGAETLTEVARQHGFALAFWQMAIDIARHHHERHDGTGYPDRLAGSAIPLAARLVTIGDVYDDLRSRRAHKPALAHSAVVKLMTKDSARQFDPGLLQAFQRCARHFEQIFRDFAD